MRIMWLLVAGAFPSIPSLRDNDVGHLCVVKEDSSVISPRPSKIYLPIPNYVAVAKHEPTPIIRVLSPLSCNEPYSLIGPCSYGYSATLQRIKVVFIVTDYAL